MLNNLAFLNSPQDLIIVAIVVVILFGGKKIPELFRGVGRGVGELQKGLEEGKRALYATEEPAHTEPTRPETKPGDAAKV